VRVIVTGGAGFIGSALIRRVVTEGHQVLNIDKLTYVSRPDAIATVASQPNYRFLRDDVVDAAAMERAFIEFDPEVIFHLAAETHVDRSIDKPAPFIETNIYGTYAVLEAALRCWSRLDDVRRKHFRVIHVSTDEVYGSLGHEGMFCEDSPYRPNSPYSASKAAADHLAHAWFVTYGLPVTVSNCSNNYGPFQHPEKLIPTVLRHALMGSPVPVYGNGKNRRDWLHVDDHVDGLMRVYERGQPGEKYLFGGRAEIANLELVQILCRILDRLKPRSSGGGYSDLISFVADRPGHDFRYAIDPTKTERELGWSAARSLDLGLEETVAWYVANPSWLVRPDAELARLGLSRAADGMR
jgi:dTDP-glucose 4,6-dehydratase